MHAASNPEKSNAGRKAATEVVMNVFAKPLSAALFFSLTTFALAQAPIVRQPPSAPPPDQQPQYSAPPSDQGQPSAPPNYDQMAQQNAPPPAPLPPEQLDGDRKSTRLNSSHL